MLTTYSEQWQIYMCKLNVIKYVLIIIMLLKAVLQISYNLYH